VKARLDPYSNSLWGIPSALDPDFELMLTGSGRLAMTILDNEWKVADRGLAYRFLGAWNVGALLLRDTPEEWAAKLARDPMALPVRPLTNPYLLPRYRFVPAVDFHDSYGSALYNARSEAYQVGRREHCVREGKPPAWERFPQPPRMLALADGGGRIRLRYRGGSPAFFVVAMTYDKGWRATLDGAPVHTYRTAICQLGVALPAGEHTLLLEYRDPLVRTGAIVTLLTLAGMAVLAFVWRLGPSVI
jgi:hypothetical protein